MFQDSKPAAVDADPALASFRVDHPAELLALLRQVRDHGVAVNLSSPDGSMLNTTLWTIDQDAGRLNFSADPADPQLGRLVESDEVSAVAYLDSVKLQFELDGLLVVRASRASALQSGMPLHLYRFQRRSAFRVRTLEQYSPVARLRHPSIPDMELALRVLDVSAGGCALFLPHDVPPLQPGSKLAGATIELDADTRFGATLILQHVSAIGPDDRGVRLGCEWVPLAATAARALQRYIDLTQKRRRLMERR